MCVKEKVECNVIAVVATNEWAMSESVYGGGNLAERASAAPERRSELPPPLLCCRSVRHARIAIFAH